MRTVVKTLSAETDIAEELTYLDDRSPAAAIRFAADLEARTLLLAGQPTTGRVRDDIAPGLRSSVIGRFLLFYTFTDSERLVVRVSHGSRDIEQILRGDGV